MKKRSLFTLAATAVGLVVSTPAAAQGQCTTESLQEMSASWIAALEQGTMMTMQLGEWVDYDQNFQRASLGGFLDQPRTIEYKLELLDLQTCQVFVEAVVDSEIGKQVIATQFGAGFFGVGGFQNIVTDENDWLFDADAFRGYAEQEDWFVVPEADRVSREELIAAANAYLDRFSNPSVEVPWGYPCTRIEGGAYTGRGEPTDTCELGMPNEPGAIEIVERQYVVDVAHQAVSVLSKFGPDQLPDSHTFRLEGGVLRYVHAATHCKGLERCGFPSLEEMQADGGLVGQ